MNTPVHPEPHELAGQIAAATVRTVGGTKLVTVAVEDYWDRVAGGSWKTATDSRHALTYALRAGLAGLPLDDEVLYGIVGSSGQLIHVSEFTPSSDRAVAS